MMLVACGNDDNKSSSSSGGSAPATAKVQAGVSDPKDGNIAGPKALEGR